MGYSYIPLFEVQILHDYFLPNFEVGDILPPNYNLNEWLIVQPTKVCQQLLRKYRLLFRKKRNGFIVLAEILPNQDNDTVIKINENLKLDFFLIAKQAFLKNYTNLPFTDSKDQMVYFNNLSGNTLNLGAATFKYLSKPLPNYLEGDLYQLGDLVQEGSDAYEVVQLPVNTPPNETQAAWEKIGKAQYVHRQDQVPAFSENFLYESLNNTPGAAAEFTFKNLMGEFVSAGIIPGTDIPRGQAFYPTNPQENFKHRISLAELPQGLYEIFLNGDLIQTALLMPGRKPDNLIGTIECWHLEADAPINIPEGFEFVDIGEDTNSPTSKPTGIQYDLHFKNRMTFWRYHAGQEGAAIHLEPFPRALSKKFSLVVVPTLNNGEPLPNPGIQVIEPVDEQIGNINTQKVYSNIFL